MLAFFDSLPSLDLHKQRDTIDLAVFCQTYDVYYPMDGEQLSPFTSIEYTLSITPISMIETQSEGSEQENECKESEQENQSEESEQENECKESEQENKSEVPELYNSSSVPKVVGVQQNVVPAIVSTKLIQETETVVETVLPRPTKKRVMSPESTITSFKQRKLSSTRFIDQAPKLSKRTFEHLSPAHAQSLMQQVEFHKVEYYSEKISNLSHVRYIIHKPTGEAFIHSNDFVDVFGIHRNNSCREWWFDRIAPGCLMVFSGQPNLRGTVFVSKQAVEEWYARKCNRQSFAICPKMYDIYNRLWNLLHLRSKNVSRQS